MNDQTRRSIGMLMMVIAVIMWWLLPGSNSLYWIVAYSMLVLLGAVVFVYASKKIKAAKQLKGGKKKHGVQTS